MEQTNTSAQAQINDGCGCCGDACATRGSCRHADENLPLPGDAFWSKPGQQANTSAGTAHTQWKLKVKEWVAHDSDGALEACGFQVVAFHGLEECAFGTTTDESSSDQEIADLHRLAACWNACDGIADPQQLRELRDALLAELRDALNMVDEMNGHLGWPANFADARALIARVEAAK